jgi:leucyl aminopeptidase
MQAEVFYQGQADDAVPLFLITQEEWDSGLNYFHLDEKSAFISQQFNGKTGDICVLANPKGLLIKAYLAIGEGGIEQALAMAALKLPAGSYDPQTQIPSTAAIKWGLAQYKFDQYKKQDTSIRKLILSHDQLTDVLVDVKSIFLVRDLINAPTNDMGPQELAEVMSILVEKHKASFEQYVGEELLFSNFPAIHAVGRASAESPRLLHLVWGDKKNPCICLVGKGVCFDSGGLDIKPASNMRLMKKDMGGAAHVLGLADWIMSNALPVYLQVFIPALENAVSGNAFRPGDILTMRNGLTVEVDNTDAEGRLVLADALVRAAETNPELIIDFATLTGAARVAVGTELAAMFTNDDNLATQLMTHSSEVKDPIWRLPLFAEYAPLLESNIADLSNCSSSPYAGAIVGALFLERFIPRDIPWVHFDIMAWNISRKPGKPEGGEAMGLLATAYFLKNKYKVN